MKPIAAVVLVAAALAACSTATSPGPSAALGRQAVLGISNGTPLTVAVYVNGQKVGTSVPGQAMDPIPFASLPALPWNVEARSSSGRVLTAMSVAVGAVTARTYPDGQGETAGAFGRVDLSCGRITIWAGYNQPSGPAPASPAGSPGDCNP